MPAPPPPRCGRSSACPRARRPPGPVSPSCRSARATDWWGCSSCCSRATCPPTPRPSSSRPRPISPSPANANRPTSIPAGSRSRCGTRANVSHELRTPLNSVIGFSDLLLTGQVEGAPLSGTQRDYLETISRNGRHLLQLINELLDLSKIAAGHMDLRLEPVTLDTLFREAADSVRAQLEARRHKL